MLICITIEETEPLAGTAAASRVAPQRFRGWLELLSAIAALVDAVARQPGSGGEELEHGGDGSGGGGAG